MIPLSDATARSIRSLTAPGMPAIVIKSIVLTIVALIGFVTLVSMAVGWFALTMDDSWLAHSLPFLATVGASLLAWMLFPSIMPLIVSFFDDQIARAVERHDYPAASPIDPLPFWPELMHDLKFALTAIALNLLVLPLYFVPMVNIFVFYLLNGYLLGREFFMMVARRYMPLSEAHALRTRFSRKITLGGMALTLLATIPFLNLIAPFWGIALMTHLYHSVALTPHRSIAA